MEIIFYITIFIKYFYKKYYIHTHTYICIHVCMCLCQCVLVHPCARVGVRVCENKSRPLCLIPFSKHKC